MMTSIRHSLLLALAFGLVAAIDKPVKSTTTEDGLKVDIMSVPEGCTVKSKVGDMLTMHYTGTLTDGTKFDSSYDRDQPFAFQLGVGQVIKGWDIGLVDMCVGEVRNLVIPPKLGYDKAGAGDVIPSDATLYFKTELVNIGDSPPTTNVFKEIDSDGNNLLSREEVSLELAFNAIDRNADGELSREEVSAYLRKQMDEADGGELKSDEMKSLLDDHDKLVEDIFQHEDQDKNGFISHEEFSGPKHDEL